MTRNPDEVRMTFGEHLEELRRRVIFALLAFGVAFIAAFAFQDPLLRFFTRPFERARASINLETREEWRPEEHARAPATRTVDELLAILRGKPGLLTPEEIARLEAAQAAELAEKPPQIDRLQATRTGETFGASMLICLLAALIASAPVLLHQMWSFVAAGLYEHERRMVLRVLPFSLLLFFAGFAFGYFVLAGISVEFLLGYVDLDVVEPRPAISHYLHLLFLLLFGMGLVFQIPLLMTVLASVGIAGPAVFRQKRRYFILAIFIVAAIITPPDYVSQLLVAGPMLVLFEAGILLAAGAARRRERREQERTAEPAAAKEEPAQAAEAEKGAEAR